MKRKISLLLCIALCISIFSILSGTASATERYAYLDNWMHLEQYFIYGDEIKLDGKTVVVAGNCTVEAADESTQLRIVPIDAAAASWETAKAVGTETFISASVNVMSCKIAAGTYRFESIETINGGYIENLRVIVTDGNSIDYWSNIISGTSVKQDGDTYYVSNPCTIKHPGQDNQKLEIYPIKNFAQIDDAVTISKYAPFMVDTIDSKSDLVNGKQHLSNGTYILRYTANQKFDNTSWTRAEDAEYVRLIVGNGVYGSTAATDDYWLDTEKFDTNYGMKYYARVKCYKGQKLLWEHTTEQGNMTEASFYAVGKINNGIAYFAAIDKMHAFDLKTGTLLWTVSNIGGCNSWIFDESGNLYVSSMWGPVFIIIDRNGNVLKRENGNEGGRLSINGDTLEVEILDWLGDSTNEVRKYDISAYKYPKANVSLNGQSVVFDQNPIIKDGRTLVPIRAVVEKMGGTVAWDDATKSATLTLGEKTIKLTVGKNTAYLNKNARHLDVAPQIIGGRTLMPIRFVAENFGYDVGWDDSTKTVLITKK